MMQKNFSKQDIKLQKQKFERLKWIGIVVNVSIVFTLAIFRYFLLVDYGSANRILPNWLIDINIILIFLTEALLLVSAVFLFAALRRFKKSFSQNQRYQQNKKIMNLQLYVMVGHMVVEVALTVLIDDAWVKKKQ